MPFSSGRKSTHRRIPSSSVNARPSIVCPFENPSAIRPPPEIRKDACGYNAKRSHNQRQLLVNIQAAVAMARESSRILASPQKPDRYNGEYRGGEHGGAISSRVAV